MKRGVVETGAPGFGARLRWWAFLALVWLPALAWLFTPLAAALVPALRSGWVLAPWLLGLALVGRFVVVNLRLARRPSRPKPSA